MSKLWKTQTRIYLTGEMICNNRNTMKGEFVNSRHPLVAISMMGFPLLASDQANHSLPTLQTCSNDGTSGTVTPEGGTVKGEVNTAIHSFVHPSLSIPRSSLAAAIVQLYFYDHRHNERYCYGKSINLRRGRSRTEGG